MARSPRHFLPGMVVEVTLRVIHGRFLLRPSDDLNEIILGILGRAQEACGIRIHAFIFMSNHYHLILSLPDADALAKFECYLNGNLAREVGRLHGWKEKVWSRRYTAIPILDDVAMVARLEYLLSHGCKEGLVASPQDWPGVSSLDAMLSGEPMKGIWFNRTAEWYARRRGKPFDKYAFATKHEVVLSPLPCWERLDENEYRARVEGMVRHIEDRTSADNRKARITPPGALHVLAEDPHNHPDQPSRSPAPLCHTSLPALRKEYLASHYAFIDVYMEASDLFRSGKLNTEFPIDCFPPPAPYTGLADLASDRAPP